MSGELYVSDVDQMQGLSRGPLDGGQRFGVAQQSIASPKAYPAIPIRSSAPHSAGAGDEAKALVQFVSSDFDHQPKAGVFVPIIYMTY